MNNNEFSEVEEDTKLIAESGGSIGYSAAGAAVGAAAAAGAANIAAASGNAYLASLAVGHFSALSTFIGATTSPAWWAVIAVNPITAPIAAAGGAAFGAYGAYKVAKKILK